MKSNAEIRRESLSCVTQGKWFFRLLIAGVVFGGLSGIVDELINAFYKANGIQTWFNFIQAKATAASQGLVYTLPSSSEMFQMHGALIFSTFIKLIFVGISYVAVAGVYLKAAKRSEERWFSDALSVFARPLGCAWLAFVVFLRIGLWTLLFIVPGIVACYRYSQVWNIKAEHPDWGASQCIAESARLMKGFKMRRLKLDVSFVSWIFIVLIFAFATFMLGGCMEPGMCSRAIILCGSLISMVACIFISVWMAAARAVFYRSVCDEEAAAESADGAIS